MYEDPVVKEERELAELEKLHRAELGLEEPKPDTGDTGKPGQEEEPKGEVDTRGEPKKSEETLESKPVEVHGDTFKARFETLQGKYNAEVPRLQEDRRRLAQENVELKRQIATLNERLTAAPKEGTPPATVEEALDDLEQEYGADFVKAVDARVERIVEKRERERLSQSAQQPSQTNTVDPFGAGMSQYCPGWEQQNNDLGFIQWIQAQREDLTDRSYQEILIEAHAAGDFVRAARIFNLYRGIRPPAQSGNQNENQPRVPRAPSPEELIAPNSRGSGAQTIVDNAKGKVWTMAEVNKFFKDLELGRFAGTEAEARNIEQDIVRANAEGRIIG